MTRCGNLWPKESIYDVAIFSDVTRKAVCRFEEALQKETLVTLKKGGFCGILQIMGLASALNCTIKLIYPDKRHTLHELLNGTFKPRLCQSLSPVITIMWTNVGGWIDRTHSFLPNHFVPLLPLTGNHKVWTTVSNKSKLKRSSSSRTCDENTSPPRAKCSRPKKTGLRHLRDFLPSTPRSSTTVHYKKTSKADHQVKGFKDQCDVKQSDREQASKPPSMSFSSPHAKNNPLYHPIISRNEMANKAVETEQSKRAGLFTDSLSKKRPNLFRVKTPLKTNQSIHGSCNHSSLKQSTLDQCLSKNDNIDLKNHTSSKPKTTTRKPLTPRLPRKCSSSSVDNYNDPPPKKNHPNPVNNDHCRTTLFIFPNNGQGKPEDLSPTAVSKTPDMATTTKTTKQTLDSSVPKDNALHSEEHVPCTTDLPLSGMRRDFYNKRGK